jgi:chromosome segregation protein
LRIEQAELERERASVARQLEEIRRTLEERERERLIAEERGTVARARLESLSREITQLVERGAALRESLALQQEEVAEAEEVQSREAAEEASMRAVVEALESSRDEAASIADQAREVLDAARREHDRFDTEVQTATDRAEQYAAELERGDTTLRGLEANEAELQQAIAAASDGAKQAVERTAELRREEAAQRKALEEAQTKVLELRERVAGLEGELSAARARASSLGALLASGAHQPDAVSELMADPAQVRGVEAVLSECMEVPFELAHAVESHLGPYLHGVVVRDWSAVERVQGWLAGRDVQGGVLLLPLDPGPNAEVMNGDSASSLLGEIEIRGAGAPWVRALLGGVALRTDDRFAVSPKPWVSPDGRRQDRWGAVHLGRPGDGDGVLSVRAELQTQREAATGAEARLGRSREEVAAAEATVVEMRAAVEARETERRTVELESRELEAERVAAEARLARLEEERADVSARVEQLQTLRTAALELDESGDDRRTSLTQSLEEAESAISDAQANARKAREKAQGARSTLHDLQLRLARAEADLRGRRDAVQRVADSLDELTERTGALETEQTQQDSVASTSDQTASSAEEEITRRLEDRVEWEAKLGEVEERISERRTAIEQREAGLRDARKAEREHSDRRHALELEVTQLRATQSSVHERLEAEWATPLEDLRERAEPLEEGDLETWDEELETVRLAISRIGPVNLLAQKEYDEEKERLEFLVEQRDDLLTARDDLRQSIRRINRSAAEAFTGTFEEIRINFQRTFRTLFEGGECNLGLEDPSDPLDSPIEISASPRGKRTQRIHLLSGGERALTALALLFAIYLVKPSPFCLMDEVDAPLDETNILRFVKMLQEFKKDTQFLVITHNARTIEAADWIYGVTMQEPGVSSIVGVQFEPVPSQVA